MATLMVDAWFSICSYCYRDCDPHEKGHYTLLGYGPDNGDPGCGEEFDNIMGTRIDITDEILHEMRPDLPIVT